MSFYRRYGDGSTEPHRQPINLESFVLRRICENCNNGWMSKLEEVVKPILVPLMRGERQLGSLEESEKWALARWVAKTAIIDSYAIGAECPIDLSVLRWMKHNLDDVPGRFAAAAFQVSGANFIGHFQSGIIRDLLVEGERVAGNITVIALPKLILASLFPCWLRQVMFAGAILMAAGLSGRTIERGGILSARRWMRQSEKWKR